jgi:hypothetical protein
MGATVQQYWPSGFWSDMSTTLLWLQARQSGPLGNWLGNALYTQGATTLPTTPAASSGLVECGISSQTNYETGVTLGGGQGSIFPQTQIENMSLALPSGLYCDDQLGPDGYPINESYQALPWGSLLCNGYQVTSEMISAENYELYNPASTYVSPGNPQTPGVVSKWQAGVNYSFGQMIVDYNGNTQMALVSGTTCSSGAPGCGNSGDAPNWPTTLGALTGDYTQVWKLIALGYQPGFLALGYCFNLLNPLDYYRVDFFSLTDVFYYQGSSTLYPTALGGNALQNAGTFSIANVHVGFAFAALYPTSVAQPAVSWSGATIPAGWVCHSNTGVGYALAGYKAQVYVKTDIEYLQEDNIPVIVQSDEFHARAGSSVQPLGGTPTVHILYDDPVAGWTEVYSSLQTLSEYQDLPRSFDVPANDPLYIADPTVTEGALMQDRCFIYDAALAIIAYSGANNFAAANRIIQQLNYFLDNPGYLAVNILENSQDGNSASRWTASGSGDTVTDVDDPTMPPYGANVTDFHAANANDSFTYKGPAQIGSAFPDTTDGQLSFQHKENAVGFVFTISLTTTHGLVTEIQITSATSAPASLSGTVITVGVGPGVNFYRTQLVDAGSLVSTLAGDTLASLTGFKVTLTTAGDMYFSNLSVGGLQPANSLAFSYDVYNGAIDQAYVRVGAMAWVVYAYCVYMQLSLDFSSILYLQNMFEFLLTLQSTASDQTNGLFTLGWGEYENPGYQYIPGKLGNCSTEHNIDMWFACSRAALTLPTAATTLLKTNQITSTQASSVNAVAEQLAGIATTLATNIVNVLYVAPSGSLPGHFAQGVSSAGLDPSYALDCSGSWGALFADAIGRDDLALQCLEFVIETFLLTNQQILKSSATNTYNETYQEVTPFNGFMNYANGPGGYSGVPDSVWQEGTWQVILALLRLYSTPGLASYFTEIGTTIDAVLSELISGQATILSVTGNGSLIGYSLAYRNLPYEFEVWPMLAPTAWMWIVSIDPSLLLTAVSERAMLPNLIIPNGQNQKVRDIDGASSVGTFSVECIDPSGELKALAAQANIIGQMATFSMGFPGLAAGDFVTMHTVQITDVGFDSTSKVKITCGDVQRFFTGAVLWANGGPDEYLPGNPATLQPVGQSWLANDFQCSSNNPRWLSGNPLDIYLAAMQNELGVGQDPALEPLLSQSGNTEGLATANPFWAKYLPGDDSTLINPNQYLDVPGILALRDGQFSGVWFEFKITSPVEAKGWLEDYILKPLGLVSVVHSTGLLSLKSMKNAQDQSPVLALTQKNVMGIPAVSREPIINVLTARMDVDDDVPTTAARTYDNQVTYEQQTSIYQFRRIFNQQVEGTGWRSAYGAYLLAFLLADRIFRRYAFATPHYQVKSFLANITAEIGDYVSLTHPLVPDLESGQVGITNVLCEVVGRQPNYARGTVTFDLYDTRFMQLTTPHEIAPAADNIPAWGEATAAQQAQYMFIADSNGENPDGSPGNTIF